MLGKRCVGTACAARIDQIGCVTSDKAIRIGRQAAGAILAARSGGRLAGTSPSPCGDGSTATS